MHSRPRTAAVTSALLLMGLAASLQFAWAKKKNRNPELAQMDERKRTAHVLNRLTFGPRPGDLQHVTDMGIDKWIDLQLHPDRIDDAALAVRLEPLRTLRMDSREIAENFPPPQMIKAVADGKQPLPSDPARRAIYQAQLERYQQRQEKKQEAANNAAAPTEVASKSSDGVMVDGTNAAMNNSTEASRREERLYAELRLDQLIALPPGQRMQAVLKIQPIDQLALAPSLKGKKGDEFFSGMSAQQKETIMALNNPQQVVNQELADGKLLSDIYSERQLLEVMTDFWFNHFNVFIGKGADHYFLPVMSAMSSGRMRWASSRIFWLRQRRAQPCCSISITG